MTPQITKLVSAKDARPPHDISLGLLCKGSMESFLSDSMGMILVPLVAFVSLWKGCQIVIRWCDRSGAVVTLSSSLEFKVEAIRADSANL
jgi:hypothetical protein